MIKTTISGDLYNIIINLFILITGSQENLKDVNMIKID